MATQMTRIAVAEQRGGDPRHLPLMVEETRSARIRDPRERGQNHAPHVLWTSTILLRNSIKMINMIIPFGVINILVYLLYEFD